MLVERAEFRMPPDPPIPELAIWVTIRGEGFEQRAIPIVARVGDQELRAIMPAIEFDGILGFLGTEPAVGDELRVGYLGDELIPTGITYQGLEQ